MARAKKYPLKIESLGEVVTIYRTEIGGKVRFQLRWKEEGELKRETYTDEGFAGTNAQTIADRLAAKSSGALMLTPEEALIYRRALAHANGHPLDQAVEEWAKSRSTSSVTLAEVADAFLAQLRTQQDREELSEVYVRRAGYRLGMIKKMFPERKIGDLRESELGAFLDGLKGSPRTRKNMRDLMVTMWRWSRGKYLPRDITTEAERIPAPKIKRKTTIAIFTPDEMRSILAVPLPLRALRKVRPALATCAFSGVRQQGEITRLHWEHIRWNQNVIEVEGKNGGERRLVPLRENLRAWLELDKQDSGPIIPLLPDKAFRRAAVAAGLKWKHNALRHSYGSYRVAETKNIHQVSLEMGNSPAMVKRHYLEAVHEDEAEKWFSIFPNQ
jgi:hypothetical protein